MEQHFPLKFTLESGTHVEVTQGGGNTYNFALVKSNGTKDDFSYIEDGRSKDAVEENLDFDQLNALRTFWLKRTDVV